MLFLITVKIKDIQNKLDFKLEKSYQKYFNQKQIQNNIKS